jgi:hypothetical protein
LGGFDSFRIYGDVKKFLIEVNVVIGALFKVCDSYSETRLYSEEPFTKWKDDPIFLDTILRGPPSSPPERGVSPPPAHPEPKRSDLFKAIMLDSEWRSVTGDQSKGKESKIFSESVLDTVKLRNGLVLDPE